MHFDALFNAMCGAVTMPVTPLPPGTFALEIAGQYKGANESAVFKNFTSDCKTIVQLDKANHYGLCNYNPSSEHQVRLACCCLGPVMHNSWVKLQLMIGTRLSALLLVLCTIVLYQYAAKRGAARNKSCRAWLIGMPAE